MAPATAGVIDGPSSFWSSKLGVAVAAGTALGGCALLYYIFRDGESEPEAAPAAPPKAAAKGAAPKIAADAEPKAAPVAPPEAAATLEGLKEAGNKHYSAKRYGDAMESYDKALALAIPRGKTTAMILCNRAAVLKIQNQYAPAIENLNEAISLEPNYFRAFHRRGQCYKELKDFKSALRDLYRAIRTCSDPKVGLGGDKTQLNKVLKEFQELSAEYGKMVARETLEKRECKVPANYMLRMHFAKQPPIAPEEPESVAALTESITVAGDDGATAGLLHYRRAIAKIQSQKFDGLHEDISAAVKLLRDAASEAALVEALSLQGEWLLLARVPFQASATLDEALAINPNHARTLCRKAVVMAHLGEDATAIFQQAQKADPNDAGAFFYMAQLWPLTVAEKLGKMDPKNPVVQTQMSAAWAHAGKLYEECIKVGCVCVPVLVGLASVKMKTGDIEGADKLLETADAKSPRDPTVLCAKAQRIRDGLVVRLTRGEMVPQREQMETLDSMVECYDEALKLDESFPATYVEKAMELLKLGSNDHTQSGLQLLERCASKFPEFDQAHVLLGQASIGAKNFEAAPKHWAAAKEYNSDIATLSMSCSMLEECAVKDDVEKN